MLSSNVVTKLSNQSRWLKRGDKIDFTKLSYLPEFKLGKPINSGLDADVFELQKYPDLVARVEHGKRFKPFDIRRVKENVRHIWASNANESVTIMEKVKGKPLYSANWSIGECPDKKDYLKHLDEILELPDSTFHQYIDDLEKIRANGCRVDTINPNNFLLDSESKRINIIDIDKGKNRKNYTNVEDFYPFVDEHRLLALMKSLSPSDQKLVTDKVKQFFGRVEKIGNERNIDLSVQKVDHNHLQDIVTYMVYDDKEMLNIYFH